MELRGEIQRENRTTPMLPATRGRREDREKKEGENTAVS
jgi:hypothetical protein